MSYELSGLTSTYLSELLEAQQLNKRSLALAEKIEQIRASGDVFYSETELVTENLSNTFGIRVAPLVGDYERHHKDDWTHPSVDCRVEVERNDGWRRCALRVAGTSIMGQALELRYVLCFDDNDQLLPLSGVYIGRSITADNGEPKWTDEHVPLMLADVAEADAILLEVFPFAH